MARKNRGERLRKAILDGSWWVDSSYTEDPELMTDGDKLEICIATLELYAARGHVTAAKCLERIGHIPGRE